MSDSSSIGHSPGSESKPDSDAERRSFLVSAGAIVIGALVTLFPFFPGLLTFFDPLRRQKRIPGRRANEESGGNDFIHICSLDGLVENGPPQRFPVIADQIDAWNFTPVQPIGAVYVQRTGADAVRVFNATCPHAGCSVASDGQRYNCPCHNSSFHLDGTKRESSTGKENPSPRSLDALDVEPERLASGEVWVKFRNFYIGREEKIPKL